MREITDEWVLGNRIPMLRGVDFIQVQLLNDTLRVVHRRPHLDFSSLWFADCTHPTQNTYCSEENIKAWRLKPTTLQEK